MRSERRFEFSCHLLRELGVEYPQHPGVLEREPEDRSHRGSLTVVVPARVPGSDLTSRPSSRRTSAFIAPFLGVYSGEHTDYPCYWSSRCSPRPSLAAIFEAIYCW